MPPVTTELPAKATSAPPSAPGPIPQAAKTSAPLAARLDGFPPTFVGRVPAVEVPPCKIYYPSYSQFSADQKRAYVYWRQELIAGVVLDVPATYRFLYAYELGARCADLSALERGLRSLRNAYLSDKRFAAYIASWALSARLARRDFSFDELVESSDDPRLQVDLSLFNQLPPSDEALVKLISDRVHLQRRVRAVHAIRATDDTDRIVAAAAAMKPAYRNYHLFNGYPVRREMFVLGTVEIPTFTASDTDPVMVAIRQLTESAATLLVDIAPPTQDVEFVEREGTAVTYPIQRDESIPRAAPILPIESVQGLQLSIDGLWSTEMQAVMAVVLWQAEVKPYIEGEITFSSGLRKKYEAFASAAGLESGVGPYRRGFFYLTRGARAPWRLAVAADRPTDMHIGTAVARFSIGLQHLLRGSAARAEVLDLLLTSLARCAGKTPPEIAAALIAGTGAERPPGVTY